VLGAQPVGQVGVVLGLADQGAVDGAGVRAGQERGEVAQVGSQVGGQVTGVGRGEFLGQVVAEGVEQDRGLGRPPAVDRLLGHAGPGRDALHGQRGEPVFGQQVVGGFQDGPAGRLAAPVPVPTVLRRHGSRA
jgi:hypothetical protein